MNIVEATLQSKSKWVLFKLKDDIYAFPSSIVREIIAVQSIRPLPNESSYITGVTNLRGEVLTVVDLRVYFGIESNKEEKKQFIEMLKQREKDHRDWLTELESSVLENRTFGKEKDYTKCAFGKWFYSFKTPNIELSLLLDKFEMPHMKIHGLASRVLSKLQADKREEAMEMIQSAKNNELNTLLDLFKEAYKLIEVQNRTIGIVIESEQTKFLVAVDDLLVIEKYEASDFAQVEQTLVKSPIVTHTLKRKQGNDLVLVLDPHIFLQELKRIHTTVG